MADDAANDRPPTVPIALPPVRTALPAASAPAPIAVFLSCVDTPTQTANPISATAEIGLSVQLYIGFINCLFCSVE